MESQLGSMENTSGEAFFKTYTRNRHFSDSGISNSGVEDSEPEAEDVDKSNQEGSQLLRENDNSWSFGEAIETPTECIWGNLFDEEGGKPSHFIVNEVNNTAETKKKTENEEYPSDSFWSINVDNSQETKKKIGYEGNLSDKEDDESCQQKLSITKLTETKMKTGYETKPFDQDGNCYTILAYPMSFSNDYEPEDNNESTKFPDQILQNAASSNTLEDLNEEEELTAIDPNTMHQNEMGQTTDSGTSTFNISNVHSEIIKVGDKNLFFLKGELLSEPVASVAEQTLPTTTNGDHNLSQVLGSEASSSKISTEKDLNAEMHFSPNTSITETNAIDNKDVSLESLKDSVHLQGAQTFRKTKNYEMDGMKYFYYSRSERNYMLQSCRRWYCQNEVSIRTNV